MKVWLRFVEVLFDMGVQVASKFPDPSFFLYCHSTRAAPPPPIDEARVSSPSCPVSVAVGVSGFGGRVA